MLKPATFTAAAVLILAAPGAAPAQSATASARVIDGVVHMAPSGIQMIKISHDLTPEQLARIIPVDEGRFVVAMYRCGGLSSNGRLESCTPAGRYWGDEPYAPAGALADHLFAPAGTTLTGPVKDILVAIRFEHSVAPARNGPCYPTVCTAVIPPPPPPPPPP